MDWTVLTTAGLLAGAALVLSLLGRVTRWGVLRFRRRSPRIQITQFSWTGGEGGESEALWVTSLFREHLRKLRVDGLDPVPDRAPGAPAVEIVEGVGQALGQRADLGEALGRLWRAMVPDCGYEAWATLRPGGEGSDSGEISVQLVELGRGNRTLLSFRTGVGEWEKVAREAALAASGALYPRVANKHKGPWSRWREPVEPALLGQYQDALAHEAENRLEQALGGFRAALEKDPLNPHLRLKVAMIEEQLELHLDAWFTYRAIVDEPEPALWRGPQRRARLIALYRLAIHLWNPEVARQWVGAPGRKPSESDASEDGKRPLPDGEKHEESLQRMRGLLRTALAQDPLFRSTHFVPNRGLARMPSRKLIQMLAQRRGRPVAKLPELFETGKCSWAEMLTREERIQWIEEVLQIRSLRYLEELRNRMRLLPTMACLWWPDPASRRLPLSRWLRRKEFSTHVIGVSEMLVRFRILARGEWLRQPDNAERLDKAWRKLLRRWPVRGGITGTSGSGERPRYAPLRPRRWKRLRLWASEKLRDDAWVLHYNAACTVATLLLLEMDVEEERGLRRDDLVATSVEQLEAFAHRARSAHVANMAEWIVVGDPDLAALFEEKPFRLWASHHLGRNLPARRPERPRDPDRYILMTIERGAEALASRWRERAATNPVSAATVVDWWRKEDEIWAGIGTLLRERESWEARLEALRRWSDDRTLSTVNISHEPWDAKGDRSSPREEFLAALYEVVDSEDRIPTRVREERDRVERRQERRLRDGDTDEIELEKSDREAALKAAHTWRHLAALLREELDGKKPKSKRLKKLGKPKAMEGILSNT